MALETVGGASPQDGISRLTTEYIYWKIVSDTDFVGAAVYVAFKEESGDKPSEQDWNSGDLLEHPDDPESDAIRILVGPDGGVDLTPETSAPKTYRVWLRIDTQEENIIRSAGTLKVR